MKWQVVRRRTSTTMEGQYRNRCFTRPGCNDRPSPGMELRGAEFREWNSGKGRPARRSAQTSSHTASAHIRPHPQPTPVALDDVHGCYRRGAVAATSGGRVCCPRGPGGVPGSLRVTFPARPGGATRGRTGSSGQKAHVPSLRGAGSRTLAGSASPAPDRTSPPEGLGKPSPEARPSARPSGRACRRFPGPSPHRTAFRPRRGRVGVAGRASQARLAIPPGGEPPLPAGRRSCGRIALQAGVPAG